MLNIFAAKFREDEWENDILPKNGIKFCIQLRKEEKYRQNTWLKLSLCIYSDILSKFAEAKKWRRGARGLSDGLDPKNIEENLYFPSQ